MIPGDSNESLTEDGPVPGYDDDAEAERRFDEALQQNDRTELDQVNELLEAVADVLADYANEIGVVPSISRLYNAAVAYNEI